MFLYYVVRAIPDWPMLHIPRHRTLTKGQCQISNIPQSAMLLHGLSWFELDLHSLMCGSTPAIILLDIQFLFSGSLSNV